MSSSGIRAIPFGIHYAVTTEKKKKNKQTNKIIYNIHWECAISDMQYA